MKAAVKDRLRKARWQYRRAKARRRYGKVDAPILFANSFPKSGTHLLTQVLSGFTQLGPFVNTGLPAVTMFDGPTGQPRMMLEIQAMLGQL